MIPGLENARFTRLGQVHRNTFLNSPIHLNRFYRLKTRPRVRIAGQITGVEGYLESAATGLAAGLYLSLERAGVSASALPVATALGALARHLTESNPARFQPANINYGLFPELGPELGPEIVRRSRRHERRQALAERAHDALLAWCRDHRVEVVHPQPAKDSQVLTCAS